jgi:hypothetical protein
MRKNGMGGACSTDTETGSGNRKGRDHFGDLVIDARILLKCMLDK